ncbi:hypothetical protein NL676_000879 [Syzygium grande]|nr:hypothetical protein NL676_000879 [Syzygium grande]
MDYPDSRRKVEVAIAVAPGEGRLRRLPKKPTPRPGLLSRGRAWDSNGWRRTRYCGIWGVFSDQEKKKLLKKANEGG